MARLAKEYRASRIKSIRHAIVVGWQSPGFSLNFSRTDAQRPSTDARRARSHLGAAFLAGRPITAWAGRALQEVQRLQRRGLYQCRSPPISTAFHNAASTRSSSSWPVGAA
jgi:hypothetical protein